jgi:hypothetical protein
MKAIACLTTFLSCLLAAPSMAADVSSRYPIPDEAFYVLSCMQRNGQDAEGLRRCSCAINAVEQQLPYEQYSQAVVVFAMRQPGGERAAIFRDTNGMKAVADRFVRAQSEANHQCFGSKDPAGSHPG